MAYLLRLAVVGRNQGQIFLIKGGLYRNRGEPSVRQEATVYYADPQARTFTIGTHLALVEVDVETGLVMLLAWRRR